MSNKLDIQVKLAHVKSTKNTEVYGTSDAGAVIPQVYIQKSAFDGKAPGNIVLIVTAN